MPEKNKRIFLDSNVIFSGLISDKGAPRVILDIISLNVNHLKGVTGGYNIIEIKRNLAKKIPSAIPVFDKFIRETGLEIIRIPSQSEIAKYRGHTADKDIPVIASAVIGKAKYLITGDKKDFGGLKTSRRYPFAIASPAEFVNGILPELIIESKE